jgi:hypothetical protein
VLAAVEADRPAAEVDRRRRAALRAHHPRRARARALAGGGGIDHDHLRTRRDAAGSRASASTAMAALRPLRAITLPPGWVAAPQKYRPGTGVRGVSRCSHIWSGVTSPWKMLPPVSPMRCSMSGGPSTS